ncbi:MAG: DUF1684 domain-containing protein [Chloroflexi bacterium]|nr:DUF1684 domain-containing protein [Chloroflexota bacterium]
MATDEHELAVLKWREERMERLRTNERSWLGLAGLFWLKDGDNSFGSDPACSFVLPASAPNRAGVFHFEKGAVTVTAESGVEMTCNGDSLPSRALLDDQQEHPDFLRVGSFILVVLIRGESMLVRVWDVNHPARAEFQGLNFYPYKPEYRVVAKYEGYAPFKLVSQKDIIGEVSDFKMIGYVTFQWDGRQQRLDVEDAGDGLFVAFRDATNSKKTYPGGRYMLTGKPENGQVLIDFNKAYNMPCAYTLYATCTLPPMENRLSIPIEAGEQIYKDDH